MARKKTVNARKNQGNDMKSVQTKHGYLTFINNPETRVFDKIKCQDFVSVNSLTEAEKHNIVSYNLEILERSFLI